MKRLVFSFVLFATFVVALCAQTDLQPLVTVKLNKSESITLKQLKARVEVYQIQASLAGNTAPFTVDERKQILEAMIDEKLFIQAALKAGISVTDSQTSEYFMSTISSQIGQNVTEAQFADIIKQQTGLSLDQYMKKMVGMSVADYKAYLKNQLISQQYIMNLKSTELQAITPTDAEVRSYYELNKSSFVQNDILKVFIVSVPKDTNKDEANRKAVEFYNDLKNKKVTVDQLKVKSQVKNSGYRAGDMYISKTAQAASQMGMDYQSLLSLFNNDVGFTSSLNETDEDFQFFVILDKTSAKILELSDIVQPETTTTVYEFVKNLVWQQKQSEYLIQAVQEVSDTLRTSENYQMLKTGDALTKLLSW